MYHVVNQVVIVAGPVPVEKTFDDYNGVP